MARRGEHSLRLIIIDRKSHKSGGYVLTSNFRVLSGKFIEWADAVCLVHCIGTPVLLLVFNSTHTHTHGEVGWYHALEAVLVLIASLNGLRAAHSMIFEPEWRLAIGLAISSSLVPSFFIMGDELLMSVALVMLIALRLYVRSSGLCAHPETCPTILDRD